MECGIRDAACIDAVDALQNSIEIFFRDNLSVIRPGGIAWAIVFNDSGKESPCQLSIIILAGDVAVCCL